MADRHKEKKHKGHEDPLTKKQYKKLVEGYCLGKVKAKVYGVRECHEDGMEPEYCIIEFDRHGIALDDVPRGTEDKAFKSAKKAEKHIRAMGGIIAGDYFDLCERLILPDYMDRRIPLMDIMDITDGTKGYHTGMPDTEQADKPKGISRKQG